MMAYVLVILYLVSGYCIWRFATSTIGGKEGYYEYLQGRFKNPKAMLILAEWLVITLWPYFIIWSIVGGDKGEE